MRFLHLFKIFFCPFCIAKILSLLYTHALGQNEGLIIKTPYFSMLLNPNEIHKMFQDDLWWNVPTEIEKIAFRSVVVMPTYNPMVARAEQVFKDALKK